MKSESFWIFDMLVKILALAVTGTLLTVILKKHCRELVPFFEFAVVIVALIIIADADIVRKNGLERIFSLYSQGSEIFTVLFKGAAVTVLTKLASDVCRESGNGLMGDIVELGGRIMLILLSVPFIEKVAEIALSFA